MTTPTGFLFSQIGYDLSRPMRAVVRGNANTLSPDAHFEARRGDDVLLSGAVKRWGELWNSCWWTADFSALNEAGRFQIAIIDDGRERFSGEIKTGAELLWDETWWPVSVEQGERRAKLAKNRLGWQDCGSHWQEANSHAAYAIGLLDLLELRADELSATQRERLERQIVNGCDYLAMLQDRATERRHADGALVHEIPTFEDATLPGDATQACIAWARAARLLSDSFATQKADYARRAERAFAWFQACSPCGAQGFSPTAHGVSDDLVPPNEHLTCDLMTALWAAWELSRNAVEGARYKAFACDFARQIASRQVTREHGQDGFYGYFRAYDGVEVSEKAWLHALGKSGIGSDVTATFPHYFVPLLEMLRANPQHADAEMWRQMLRDFAYGYFLPACRANPFGLLPLGLFPDGLLWFAGLWHGMNCVYAWACALALEFEREFNDCAFGEVAIGNLQWIAGLNAGLTRDSLFASHIWDADVEADKAVPVSMICGIGAQRAGNWLHVRGAICNGFSTGDQFVFDVEPKREHDGPHAFTDEDWIPHAGAWLSAISRLKN